MGDKRGQIFLLDAARKIILDSTQAIESKWVSQIESKCILWADTELYFIPVVQRGVSEIKIYALKNNENKFYHFYTIKGIVPDTESVPTPETFYLDYPWETKLSEDCLFLLVTTYWGTVWVLRMP